jgi:LmbE family N-acetylglucosaminyl deacetylase
MEEQKNLNPLDENWERALAVVAHPDDLEYGAASAVARWTSQGKQINYLMVSRGEELTVCGGV